MSLESSLSEFLGISVRFLCLLGLLILAGSACADTEYYRHILFDNSLESDAYYYSAGKVSSPSSLELDHGKLPVSKTIFYTPPNALRLKWRSDPAIGFGSTISALHFRNHQLSFRPPPPLFSCVPQPGIASPN